MVHRTFTSVPHNTGLITVCSIDNWRPTKTTSYRSYRNPASFKFSSFSFLSSSFTLPFPKPQSRALCIPHSPPSPHASDPSRRTRSAMNAMFVQCVPSRLDPSNIVEKEKKRNAGCVGHEPTGNDCGSRLPMRHMSRVQMPIGTACVDYRSSLIRHFAKVWCKGDTGLAVFSRSEYLGASILTC